MTSCSGTHGSHGISQLAVANGSEPEVQPLVEVPHEGFFSPPTFFTLLPFLLPPAILLCPSRGFLIAESPLSESTRRW